MKHQSSSSTANRIWNGAQGHILPLKRWSLRQTLETNKQKKCFSNQIQTPNCEQLVHQQNRQDICSLFQHECWVCSRDTKIRPASCCLFGLWICSGLHHLYCAKCVSVCVQFYVTELWEYRLLIASEESENQIHLKIAGEDLKTGARRQLHLCRHIKINHKQSNIFKKITGGAMSIYQAVR